MDDWWCSLDDDGHHGQDIERLRLRWVIELIMTEEDASNMTPSDKHNNNIDGSISFSPLDRSSRQGPRECAVDE